MGDALKNGYETMTKKFYPNDGRPGIPVSSEKDIADYMGDVMKDFGPIEIEGDLVLTQLHGQYIAIGKMK